MNQKTNILIRKNPYSTILAFRICIVIFFVISGANANSVIFAKPILNIPNVWTPLGLYGVRVVSLVVDPNNNQIIFAGTQSSTTIVFKSKDGGTTWSASSNGISTYILDNFGFIFDPNNASVIYMATGDGLFKSSDSGGNWTLIGNIQSNGVSSTLAPTALTISPLDGTIFLASVYTANMNNMNFRAAQNGLYRSRDGGTTWELIKPLVGPFPPIALAVAPSAPHIIYSSGYGSVRGIFKSTDGGNTWQEIDSSFGVTPFVLSIAIDKHDAQVVYLGTSQNGIFKTINGGQSWAPIGTGLGNINVDTIQIDPKNEQVLYLGGGDIGASATNYGVYRSLDNAGLSWAAMNDGMGNRSVNSLAFDNGSPESIYAGTPNGVWKYIMGPDNLDFSVAINNGDLFTNTTAVTLTLTAPPLTDQMMISNDGGFGGVNWEPYVTQKNWTITSYGSNPIPRTVYAKFKRAGQISGQYQDDIVLDQTPPTGSIQINKPLLASEFRMFIPSQNPLAPLGNAIYLPAIFKNYHPGMRPVNLVLSAQDDLSGVGNMLISNDNNFTGAQWQSYTPSIEWWVFDKGNTTVFVKYRDRAGNESQIYSADTIAP
jgi:photosystem II stability/assembly factor-like uncharacterized protein